MVSFCQFSTKKEGYCMREIVLRTQIGGSCTTPADHDCLRGVDMSILPAGRMDMPVTLIRETASQHVTSASNIKGPFLNAHPGILFKEGGKERYYTAIQPGIIVEYRILSISEQEYWTIYEQDNIEYLYIAKEGDQKNNIDEKTGYCQSIITEGRKLGR